MRRLVLGLGLGLGVAALGAAVALRRRPGLRGVRDQVPSTVLRVIEPEIDDAERRAYAAGAQGDLEYIGTGMTGIVFCDRRDRAFKVARGEGSLADEAAWLKLARTVPGIRQHIARGARWDAKHRVLVRECARGKVGTWSQSRKLRDLHDRIEAAMVPYGWTSPEFKEDSYVTVRGRGPVLVDASMAHRVGRELVKDTLAVLNRRRPLRKYENYTDHGFALRMERGRTVPAPVADRLLRRLKAIDPKVDLANEDR